MKVRRWRAEVGGRKVGGRRVGRERLDGLWREEVGRRTVGRREDEEERSRDRFRTQTHQSAQECADCAVQPAFSVAGPCVNHSVRACSILFIRFVWQRISFCGFAQAASLTAVTTFFCNAQRCTS